MDSEEEEQLANLRAFRIVKESFKLLFGRFQIFCSILFTLGLPYLILFTLQELAIPNYPTTIFPPPEKPSATPDGPAPAPARPPLPDGEGDHALMHSFWLRRSNLGRDFSVSSDLMLPVLRLLGAVIIHGVVEQFVRALWVAGTIYTVGLIYLKKSVSFKEVIRTVPQLWNRLMVTWLFMVYILVTGYAIFFTILGGIVLCNLGYDWTTFLGLFPFRLLSVCGIAIGIVAEVAEGVTVFEESLGSEAFSRSMELLEDKRRVAVGVFSLWRLLLYLLSRYLGGGVSQQNLWDAKRILSVTSYSFAYCMLTQVYQICRGVLYVSFKAFHGESIPESTYFQTLTGGDMEGDMYHALDANSACVEPQDLSRCAMNSVSNPATGQSGNSP